MDLRSLARAVRAFHIKEDLVGEAGRPIGDRALIGDGLGTALVRVDGAIDWLCWPRMDADPVFFQILDPERGGVTAVSPVQRPFESQQRYDPETAVVETIMNVPGQGVVRLTDYMPWLHDVRASIHEIHRRVEGLEGEVELEVVFDPRFGFGERSNRFESDPNGVMAISIGGERLAIATGGDGFSERKKGGLQTRMTLKKGDRRWVILSWGAPRVEPIEAYRPFELLRSTRRSWRNWAHQLEYDGPWRHLVLRSAITLKLLQYGPTGALIAAPTSSLPEALGGPRNWDYRYAWARDAAMTIRSTSLIGYPDEAREFFHFVRETLSTRRAFPVMATIDGGDVPAERIIEGLRGYRGSAPVRQGNGAHRQLQIDGAGYVMDAAWIYEHIGGSLTLGTWRQLARMTEAVCKGWNQADHGIWEPRGGKKHHVHSRGMSWVALDRAARIAPLFGDDSLRERWQQVADEIRSDVLVNGLDPSKKALVSHYGGDEMDASLLLLPLYQFLSADHPLVVGTVERIQSELLENGFVLRYRYDDGVDPEGAEEGAFVICGFWLAEALAMMGRVEEAVDVFSRHAGCANHLGLLSEEVEPKSGLALGNFPQAFSHLGLINAACRIDLALRLQDEGEVRTPVFELDAMLR